MPVSGKVPIRNLEHIRKKDPKLYEAIVDIQAALLPQSQQAPPPVTNLSVVSNGAGGVDVTFTDSEPVNQGVNYFVEHDSNPNFTQPRVEDFGASRSGTILIGSGTRYFKAYSQYRFPPSPPSLPIVFGGQIPTPITGGGTATPVLLGSTGSGTANTNGQLGGSGFGKFPIRPARIAANSTI